MIQTVFRSGRHAVPLLLLAVGACVPGRRATGPSPRAGLPSVPRVEGPLAVRVAYPIAGAERPRVDSTFIFGTTGNGASSLTINGAPVEVASNGAFLAFLPVPADGVWRLAARVGDQTTTSEVAYRAPAPPESLTRTAPARPVREAFPAPVLATVMGVQDTLATGSDIAPGLPTANPNADRRWLLPNGARLVALARQGNLVEVRLDERTQAWFTASQLRLGEPLGAEPSAAPLRAPVTVRPAAAHTDVRIPASGAAFLVGGDGSNLRITLHGVALPQGAPNLTGDPLLAGGRWDTDSVGGTVLELSLRPGVWGYKAFYEPDGTLVMRLRRPPTLDPRRPLRGLRIVVDPGHPPGGAIGPTGLTEPEATLPVALRLADLLRGAGAQVLMTRTGPGTLSGTMVQGTELTARVNFAVQNDAQLMVSVHFNAFGEGQNPFRNYGSSVLYFHPHNREFAAIMDRELVRVTQIPAKGALFQNIALGRPTWVPSVLTESLFMMFPQQEHALRVPEFQQRLAEAHLRGIEAFVRQRAGLGANTAP